MVIDLEWFEPLPKQLALIQSTAEESCYAGGVGSGKTLSGGMKALTTALAYPGTVGLVGRQSYRALEDTTKKVLVDGDDKPPIIPHELIASRSESEQKVTLRNGSEILFRSFQDFNIEKLLSLNLGWVYVDELTETTEKIWLTLLGRLRHPAGPRIAWGTTNPNGHDWVWRRFHPDSGQAVGELYHAPTEDNPHLPPDYIKRLRSMPREWQKRFVDANFDTAAGQIWEEWDSAVHVIPWFEIPYDWRRFESLDHGRRNPTAVLWYVIDFDGYLIVRNGYYQPGLVSQHAAAITKIRGNRKYGAIVADPQVFTRGHDGQCVADEYERHGIALARASNEVNGGLLRVSEWLLRRPDEVFPDWHPFARTLGPDGLGSPRMFVLDVPGTLDLRRELPDYRWRDLSPVTERDRDQPEEPRKKDDHACDALRYGIMSRPRPGMTAEERTAHQEREIPEHARAISAGIESKVF
jgi:PBSX family phage terminase large subunit